MRQVVHPHTWEPGSLPGPLQIPCCGLARKVGLFGIKATTNALTRKTCISVDSILTSNQPMTIIFCSHFIIVITSPPQHSKILKAVLKRQLSVRSGGECGIASAWGDVVL